MSFALNLQYSIIARNIDDIVWEYDLQTNNIFKFIICSVKYFIKYDVVTLGKHG